MASPPLPCNPRTRRSAGTWVVFRLLDWLVNVELGLDSESLKAFPSYCVTSATSTQGLAGDSRNWQVHVEKFPEQTQWGNRLRVWAVSQA